MHYIAALATTLAILSTDASAQFESVTLIEDGQALEYKLNGGRVAKAPAIKGQVVFASPKIGPKGAAIGWLAEFPGTSTSYPVPLRLIVMDQSNTLHTFSGPQAIFGWCFSEVGEAVVFRQAALHGPTEQVFEMRRVADGKLLKRFASPWQGPEVDASSAKVPIWARCTL